MVSWGLTQFLALDSIVDDASLWCFLEKERGVRSLSPPLHVLLPLSWLFTIFSSFTGGKGWGTLRLTAAWVVTWRVKVEWRTYMQTVRRLLKDMKHGEVFWSVLLYQETTRWFFLFLFFLFSEMCFWWFVCFINFKLFPLSVRTDIPPLSCCRAFDAQFQFFHLILFLKQELCSA